MGKGDKKSRKGKIFMGSYGNTRPQKTPSKNEEQPANQESTENSKASKKLKGS